MAEKGFVAKTCGLLAAAYPHFELREQTVEVYVMAFHDVPEQVLEAAAKDCITTNKFFPSVAELRDRCFEIFTGARYAPSAYDAWAEVIGAISTHDALHRPSFSTPAINRALQGIGGWRHVCLSENIVADRARFYQAYESILRRDMRQAKMLPEVREMTQRLAAGYRLLEDPAARKAT